MITDTIIAAALLANFFTWYFRPFDDVRELIVERWVDFCIGTIKQPWLVSAVKIITCPKCLAFWGILLYTFNLVDAIIASMLALIIRKIVRYAESELN